MQVKSAEVTARVVTSPVLITWARGASALKQKSPGPGGPGLAGITAGLMRAPIIHERRLNPPQDHSLLAAPSRSTLIPRPTTTGTFRCCRTGLPFSCNVIV